MPIATKDLYRSPNGDRWLLIRDDTGRAFVRHQANLPSGGTLTDTEISKFLFEGGLGPEKQELLRLIGSLAEYQVTPAGGSTCARPMAG
jgi:hypothetical protein